MNHISAIIRLFGTVLSISLIQYCYGVDRYNLKPISKSDFEKGKEFIIKRYADKRVNKVNGKMTIAKNCTVFKDDNTDRNFVEYDYVGDLDNKNQYKLIKSTYYNGEEYTILDIKHGCKSYHLLGEPQLLDSMIVNLNESETTDKRQLIELWTINENGIKKLVTVDFRKVAPLQHIDIEILRMSTNNEILIKDREGRYWKLEYSDS